MLIDFRFEFGDRVRERGVMFQSHRDMIVTGLRQHSDGRVYIEARPLYQCQSSWYPESEIERAPPLEPFPGSRIKAPKAKARAR